MHEIRVPKLNSNDDEYLLVEWLYTDGDIVPAGAELALLETSKATSDLVCEHGGVLLRAFPEHHACRPGDTVARLFEDDRELRRFGAAGAEGAGGTDAPPSSPTPTPTPAPATAPDEPLITDPALRLIEDHGLDLDRVLALGGSVIGRKDVERLVGGAGGNVRTLDRHQVAVARTVTEAARTIPAASALIEVDIGPTQRAAGLAELLVSTVAWLHERFPACFGRLQDESTVVLPDQPHIGVTIDVGTGLYVPVIRSAGSLSCARITELLAEFRMRAMRSDFRPDHLTGSNIAVSLPVEGVIGSRPLILPPHVCNLALGDPRSTWGPDGAERSVARIDLTYDHRVINGREAGVFLRAFRDRWEQPGALDGQ